MPSLIAQPRSAYIHVPFCVHRCGYCDFTLVAGRDDLMGDYLRAIELELASLGEAVPVDTLFLGGGTPTHLPPTELTQLLELLRNWFQLEQGAEFSIEANPSGLTAEKVGILARAGVNRISLGVQSFDTTVLTTLERDHRQTDIQTAVEFCKEKIDNVSLDLIFGVPGQSQEMWQQTLTAALELQPTHVSTYGLTYEKGTDFWSRLQRSELTPLAEDTERQMYQTAIKQLSAAGFEHYEISNFAQPGYRCQHNQVYWTGKPYWGFGPGAARFVDGRREINHRSVTTWLKRVLAGESSVGEVDELSSKDRAHEQLVVGLRLCEGVDKAEFLTRTGFNVNELAQSAIAKYEPEGLLEETATHLRLTDAGRFVADAIIVDLL